MRIAASVVAEHTSGQMLGTDCEANGIAFDTRALVRGQAFVAIRAERDGHEYLSDARDRGAAFAIVERGKSIDGLTCIEVDNSEIALSHLAAALRSTKLTALGGRVIGVTGSAGKTSTKDFIFAVLASTYSHAHCSPASLNNDIGVPVTILNAPDECDALVLEMGMRGFGEIQRLCDVGQPHIGVLTNIGDAHSERVGGIEGVAQAKFELLRALPHDGIAILNADNEMTMKHRGSLSTRVVTFGSGPLADVRWSIESTDLAGCALATFTFNNEQATGRVGLPGQHMVANAAAAVAVGVMCNVPLDRCVAALQVATYQTGRMQWKTGVDGIRILDDSYNANTLSMMAALDMLATMPGTKVAVLGQMAEIADSEKQHSLVAKAAHELGIEVLACETTLYGTKALTVEEIAAQITQKRDVCVLVKGSRAAATERVVQLLGA